MRLGAKVPSVGRCSQSPHPVTPAPSLDARTQLGKQNFATLRGKYRKMFLWYQCWDGLNYKIGQIIGEPYIQPYENSAW